MKIPYKLSNFLLQKDTKIKQKLYAHKDWYLLITGSPAFFTMRACNVSWSLRFVSFFITSATYNQQKPQPELHAVLSEAVPISFFLAIVYNFLFSIK